MGVLVHKGPNPELEIAVAVAYRIRARRKYLGMTQKELGRLCGYQARAVGEMEAGRSMPGATRVPALCRTLRWTPNQLFGWEEQ